MIYMQFNKTWWMPVMFHGCSNPFKLQGVNFGRYYEKLYPAEETHHYLSSVHISETLRRHDGTVKRKMSRLQNVDSGKRTLMKLNVALEKLRSTSRRLCLCFIICCQRIFSYSLKSKPHTGFMTPSNIELDKAIV